VEVVVLRRSELEDAIEEQLFTAEGGGELRPLFAAKVNLVCFGGVFLFPVCVCVCICCAWRKD
jgi:hypothetical protein